MSLRANLGLDATLDEATATALLEPFMPATARLPAFEPGWLDRPTAIGWNAELPRWVLRALRVIAATQRGVAIVAMNAAQYAQLPEVWRAACRRHLAGSVLLIVHRDLAYAGQFGERAAILCDGQRLTGWVPFPAEPVNAATLELSFTRLVGAPMGAGSTSTRILLQPDEDADEDVDDVV